MSSHSAGRSLASLALVIRHLLLGGARVGLRVAAPPVAIAFAVAGFLGPGFLDNLRRILLPPALRLHAKLERDAMMVGQGRYFELWDSGVWSAKLGQALSGPAAPPPGMEGFSL